MYSSVAMLLGGFGLTVAGFIVPPVGEISDSVLWAMAQCLMFAGAGMGIDYFIDKKIERTISNEKSRASSETNLEES
mgnify:CR=1 FL=1